MAVATAGSSVITWLLMEITGTRILRLMRWKSSEKWTSVPFLLTMIGSKSVPTSWRRICRHKEHAPVAKKNLICDILEEYFCSVAGIGRLERGVSGYVCRRKLYPMYHARSLPLLSHSGLRVGRRSRSCCGLGCRI